MPVDHRNNVMILNTVQCTVYVTVQNSRTQYSQNYTPSGNICSYKYWTYLQVVTGNVYGRLYLLRYIIILKNCFLLYISHQCQGHPLSLLQINTVIKNKIKFSSNIGNSKGSGAKSYMTNDLLIYGENICTFPHMLGSPSSYMTLHPIPSEFPYISGKFSFLFIRVGNHHMANYCTVPLTIDYLHMG